MEALLVGIVMYFIPALIALVRGHHNAFAIFLTNLIFGWTVIGWLVTLIWSVTASERRVREA